MTERKPANVSWETWVDGQIRESMKRGEFDDLPGKGKPLQGLDQPHDELWWVKDKLRREGVSYLPETLKVRSELQQARSEMAAARSELQVRDIVERINKRIRYVNSHYVGGPPSTLMPLDMEEEVERWRSVRPPAESAVEDRAETRGSPDAPRRSRPWRRPAFLRRASGSP